MMNRTMNRIKVEITLNNEETFWGYVYTPIDTDYSRLQDMLNDNRKFIPIHLLQDRKGRNLEIDYRMTMFNKNYIQKIEEIRE